MSPLALLLGASLLSGARADAATVGTRATTLIQVGDRVLQKAHSAEELEEELPTQMPDILESLRQEGLLPAEGSEGPVSFLENDLTQRLKNPAPDDVSKWMSHTQAKAVSEEISDDMIAESKSLVDSDLLTEIEPSGETEESDEEDMEAKVATEGEATVGEAAVGEASKDTFDPKLIMAQASK